MRKTMKSRNKYIIINIDESYAEEIYEILKAGQIAKDDWPEGDISFNDWANSTFGWNVYQCPNDLECTVEATILTLAKKEMHCANCDKAENCSPILYVSPYKHLLREDVW